MQSKKVAISKFDKYCYRIIRKNIRYFLIRCAKKYDRRNLRVLDIAPQIHEEALVYFKKAKVETFDINPDSNTTYRGDITKYNRFLKSGTFDIIVCTEVLEHVLNPFSTVKEIYRLLKPSGILLLSAPFNFRIHGPLPDCWRFTKYGLRELLKKFKIIELNSIDTPKRNLMPIHYTVIAMK